MTLHVLNSVGSSGGYWASDIISCIFNAFGGWMMKSLLQGDFKMEFLFANNEALLTLVVVCWYIVNHDIPFTGINAWKKLTDFAGKVMPFRGILNLATLIFNCNILIDVATSFGTAGQNVFHVPTLGQIMFMCVAIHCSSEFLTTSGVTFKLNGCSETCERAVWVAVWCATNGLSTFPIVGGFLGAIGGAAEGLFGGRANFLITTILLDATIGHVNKFERPHVTIANALYKITGVNRK